jgi:hypothetical protein
MEVRTHWEAPDGTVSVFTCANGAIQVVTEPGYTRGDWAAMCKELEALGAGPYSLSDGPVAEGCCDVWTVTRELPAAA